MRADIHDGPEHTLQSEAGYIDARPLSAGSMKPLATHGRTIHSGHTTAGVVGPSGLARSTPDSKHWAHYSHGPKSCDPTWKWHGTLDQTPRRDPAGEFSWRRERAG